MGITSHLEKCQDIMQYNKYPGPSAMKTAIFMDEE